MIWSIVLAAVAYAAIATAGYESARKEVFLRDPGIAGFMHLIGLAALIAAIYLAANSN